MVNLKNYLFRSIALALVAFGLSGCGGGGTGGGGTSEAANVEFKSLPTDMTVGRGK